MKEPVVKCWLLIVRQAVLLPATVCLQDAAVRTANDERPRTNDDLRNL